MTDLTGTAVTVTDLLPDYADGSQVPDYATAFTVTTYPVSDGSATIILGEAPVLVEEGEGVSYAIYLPLVLKGYRPPLVTPTPTSTLQAGNCDAITPVDNSLYYKGTEDECWHLGDFPSPQP